MVRVQLDKMTKRYPGCVANDQVSMAVMPGEIHALLGENGAGKSTLMKMIYGIVKPDAGHMLWEGQSVQIRGAKHARALGIGMVFQHFSLFETLTVAENIALGLPREASRDMPALKQRIRDVSQEYGMALDPERFVHSLSIGEQQRVEIVRCLLQDVKLLILDEPTSVLTPQEVESLFVTLRQLAAQGCSILFISHKLEEVRSLCDGATILRAGRVTGECKPNEVTVADIARMMVGDDTPLVENYQGATGGKAFLSLRDVCFRSADPFACELKNLAFEVRRGEILGIAGVAGNGQEELLHLISGEAPFQQGSMTFGGRDVRKLNPAQRRRLGMGVVPEERLGRGAVPDMDLEDNALLTAFQTDLTRSGWIARSKLRRFARKVIEGFRVKAPHTRVQAKSLSGGNLQKYIIGREILQSPDLLVCSHPTWGVDIGAAILIRHALIALRDQGAAILVVSEDIDELYAISDRVGAICDGRLSPTAPTAEVSINQLGQWMAGHFESAVTSTQSPTTALAGGAV